MYRLIRFGDLSLVGANQVDDIGSGVTPTSYQALPTGGALDLYGNRQMHPGAVERVRAMRLRVATETADEYLQLLALRGKRDRLYRQMPDGSIHWMYARLVEVSAQRHYEQAQYKLIQDVSLRFVTSSPTWNGRAIGTWYLDTGEYLDNGLLLSMAVDVDGADTEFVLALNPDSAPVRAMRITITNLGLDADMPSFELSRAGGESLDFSAAVDGELILDTGAMQALNGGVDRYDALILGASSDLSAWITLRPGTNTMAVHVPSAAAHGTISFALYEAWY